MGFTKTIRARYLVWIIVWSTFFPTKTATFFPMKRSYTCARPRGRATATVGIFLKAIYPITLLEILEPHAGHTLFICFHTVSCVSLHPLHRRLTKHDTLPTHFDSLICCGMRYECCGMRYEYCGTSIGTLTMDLTIDNITGDWHAICDVIWIQQYLEVKI